MNTKELLQSFYDTLQHENNEIIKKEDYFNYSSLLVGNLKRMYYIKIELNKINMTDLEQSKADVNAFIKKGVEHMRGMAKELESMTKLENELYMKVMKDEVQKDDSIENHFKARVLANEAVYQLRKNN